MSFEEVSNRRIWLFSIYLIVLNLTLVYILLRIWPGTVELSSEDRVALLPGGLLGFPAPPETRFLLIVIVAGALGSYIHLATSFADYVGNQKLVWSWGLWYVLRPLIGIALALTTYFVVRGGLIAGTAGAGSLSPYGVAAIAALSGMFSKQATDKLREVFENLFTTTDPTVREHRLRD